MRTLEFTVTGQRLRRASGCSFNHIIMGSKNYLKAHFTFDNSWAGKAVAVFNGKEYFALDGQGNVDIPDSVTSDKLFTVKIIGVGRKNEFVPTNTVTIRQEEE